MQENRPDSPPIRIAEEAYIAEAATTAFTAGPFTITPPPIKDRPELPQDRTTGLPRKTVHLRKAACTGGPQLRQEIIRALPERQYAAIPEAPIPPLHDPIPALHITEALLRYITAVLTAPAAAPEGVQAPAPAVRRYAPAGLHTEGDNTFSG